MNFRRSGFLLLMFLLILSSCVNPNKRLAQEALETLSIQPIKVGELRDNIKSIKYIQLETSEECMIGEVSEVKVQDDYLIILDVLKKVYLFEKSTGRFIRQIGSIGQGAGEYVSVNTISLSPDKDGIYIFDNARGYLCFYSWSGECISQKNLSNSLLYQEVGRLTVLPEQNIVVNTVMMPVRMSANSVLEDYNQFHIDLDVDSIVKMDIPISVYRDEKYFSSYMVNPNSLYEDQFSVLKLACDTIFIYDYAESKQIVPRYKIQLPDSYKYPTPDLLIGKEQLPESTLILLNGSGYFSTFTHMYENSNMIYLRCANLMEGHALVNKNTGQGMLIPRIWNGDISIDASCERVLRGEGIFEIKGAYGDEFISVLDTDYMSCIQSVCNEKQDIELPSDLKTVLENATEDSNPCIVIYEV